MPNQKVDLEDINKDRAKAGKPVVLIVEDDQTLLRVLYILFHEKGYTVATATDGASAIEMAQNIKPDIILLDLLLPKKDGFEVLKVCKSHSNLKNKPVIILSNLSSGADIERAKTLGADDYFVKADIDLKLLAEKVEQLLKNKKT